MGYQDKGIDVRFLIFLLNVGYIVLGIDSVQYYSKASLIMFCVLVACNLSMLFFYGVYLREQRRNDLCIVKKELSRHLKKDVDEIEFENHHKIGHRLYGIEADGVLYRVSVKEKAEIVKGN